MCLFDSSSSSAQASTTSTTTFSDAYKAWTYRDVYSISDAFKNFGNKANVLSNSPIGSTTINVGSGSLSGGTSSAAAGNTPTTGAAGTMDWKTMAVLGLAGAAGFFLLDRLGR